MKDSKDEMNDLKLSSKQQSNINTKKRQNSVTSSNDLSDGNKIDEAINEDEEDSVGDSPTKFNIPSNIRESPDGSPYNTH